MIRQSSEYRAKILQRYLGSGWTTADSQDQRLIEAKRHVLFLLDELEVAKRQAQRMTPAEHIRASLAYVRARYG